MQQFVPVTDEIIFDNRESMPERLIPFSLDYPCYHWLEGQSEPQEEASND